MLTSTWYPGSEVNVSEMDSNHILRCVHSPLLPLFFLPSVLRSAFPVLRSAFPVLRFSQVHAYELHGRRVGGRVP